MSNAMPNLLNLYWSCLSCNWLILQWPISAGLWNSLILHKSHIWLARALAFEMEHDKTYKITGGQSDQRPRCTREEFLVPCLPIERQAKTLIKLCGCACQSVFAERTCQNQNQNCSLVTRQNDNHSPGTGRLVPSSLQRSELSNTILGTFSRGDLTVRVFGSAFQSLMAWGEKLHL